MILKNMGNRLLIAETTQSTGSDNIAKMKILAENGDGLNSFINKHVRKKYARKEQ